MATLIFGAVLGATYEKLAVVSPRAAAGRT